MAGAYRKMQGKLYGGNIKENGVDRTGNKRGEDMRNAHIVVVRDSKRQRLYMEYLRICGRIS